MTLNELIEKLQYFKIKIPEISNKEVFIKESSLDSKCRIIISKCESILDDEIIFSNEILNSKSINLSKHILIHMDVPSPDHANTSFFFKNFSRRIKEHKRKFISKTYKSFKK